MRKCRLIKKDVDFNIYKGESYMRALLTFEIILFGFFKYEKTIKYDVTMFSNFKLYQDNWDSMIKNKSLVSFKAIKNNIIF